MLLPHSGADPRLHVLLHVREHRPGRRRRRSRRNSRSREAGPTWCAWCARSRSSGQRRGSACTTSWMPSSSATELGVGHDAGDLDDHVGRRSSRPVISRSTHTSRSSARVAVGHGVTRRTLPARGTRVDSPPVTAPAVVWRPDADCCCGRATSRASWRPRASTTFPELVARSIAEPEWFWDAVVRFLDIRFSQPYDRVLDTSAGIPWATWFVAAAATSRSRASIATPTTPRPRDRAAVVWEGEEGEVRTLTVDRAARAHRSHRARDWPPRA